MTVTILSPRDRAVQAAFIKAHLKLMSVGLHHRNLSKGGMMAKATLLTGERYPVSKRGFEKAIAAMQQIVDAATT